MAARDRNLTMPVHLLIFYPMAGTDLNTESYERNASVKPLNKPMMEWFTKNLTMSSADMKDPRLDIVGAADLKNLPPSTVITDTIDPLQSEGQAPAEKLKQAGVTLDAKNFDGVTHEFFGMGMVVGKAKQAEDLAGADLKSAFAGKQAKRRGSP